MTRPTYRVDFEQDEDGNWLANVPDLPGCHSYGRTLPRAHDNIRDAIALWTELEPEAFDIDDRYALGPSLLDQMIEALHDKRDEAQALSEEVRRLLHETVVTLVREQGLSVRDAAVILHVSHGRVQQLLNEAAEAAERR